MYKSIIGVLTAVALMFTVIGVGAHIQSSAGGEPFPRVIALVPEWSGFVEEADKWNFGSILVTASPEAMETRFVGAQIGDQLVTSLEKVEWTEVARVSMQVEDLLAQYEELRESAVRQPAQPDGRVAPDIAEKYWGARTKILEALEKEAKEIEAIQLIIPSMRVNPGERAVVELTFEVRKKNDPTKWQLVTAPTSVSNLVLPPEGIKDGSSTWIRGDLHIHSIYSDGGRHLRELRDSKLDLKGRDYHFVYMTDHAGYCQIAPPPAVPGFPLLPHLQRTVDLCPTGPGFPGPCNEESTWQCYALNTRWVTSPEIAFFPGAELNLKHTTLPGNLAPEGHALIYRGMNLISLGRSDCQFFILSRRNYSWSKSR
ncbi:hypothetical protein M1O54_06425 [Dehalococcoidia bacterium]|nr:hypothetical protein [Dehalococcoidia bacterium]